MKKSLFNTLSLAVVPWCLAMLMRLWFATCRVTIHNEEYLDLEHNPENVYIATFWHYSFVYVFYFMRKHPAIAMVSASDDGEYIARLAKQFGFSSARGSSNNRGVGALKKLIKVVRSGENCAVVADGSQGPPRVAQAGAVLLASRTGVQMAPLVWSASRYFTIKSWDRTAIPKPFSKVDYYYGKPIFVPPRVKGAEIEQYRLQLEKSLNALYATAWRQYNKLGH